MTAQMSCDLKLNGELPLPPPPNSPPHEPKGRAGCPHPAAEQAGHSGRSRRGEDTQLYLPLAVQEFQARKMFSENSHLDPLPSSDEGRGNPAASIERKPVSVGERDAPFPLPFRRGEDQGEGLLRRSFVSVTKWKCILALSHARRKTFPRSQNRWACCADSSCQLRYCQSCLLDKRAVV